MKYSFIYLFVILLLFVNSHEKEFDPDTKYFIYNKVTSDCIKRGLSSNGFNENYIMTYGECTNDDNSLWYIRDGHIISAETGDCFSIVNYNSLGSKDCDKPVVEAIFYQNFIFEDDLICTTNDRCLRNRRCFVGDKKDKDEYYEWTISTSLPE